MKIRAAFVSWLAWAVAQKEPLRREDSAVVALDEILESREVELVELPAIEAALMERRRESVVAMNPALGDAMLQRRKQRRTAWVAILLCVIAAALLAITLVAL